MQVYVCWNDNDYYGPDQMEPFVFATLDEAKRSIEKYVREQRRDQPIGWTKATYGDRWELQQWVHGRSVRSLFYIDAEDVLGSAAT